MHFKQKSGLQNQAVTFEKIGKHFYLAYPAPYLGTLPIDFESDMMVGSEILCVI